jgi:hypothetical protein
VWEIRLLFAGDLIQSSGGDSERCHCGLRGGLEFERSDESDEGAEGSGNEEGLWEAHEDNSGPEAGRGGA